MEGDFLGDLLGTTGQKKKKASTNKSDTTQSLTKDAANLKPVKKATVPVVEAVKSNVTVTKIKDKDDEGSDEITDIVESIVTGGVDDSAENDDDEEDDDDDEDDDSKETKGVTEGNNE